MLVGDVEARNEIPASVWMWGFSTLDREIVGLGYDIASMIEWMKDHPETYFFHNLKYDGSFMADYLFKHGIKYEIMMNEVGAVYSMKFYKCRIFDSYKFAKGSLAKLAEAYGLDIAKGEMDYNKKRPIGYRPDASEVDYFQKDLFILADVVKLAMGVSEKKTLATRAYDYYVKLHPSDGFYYHLYPRVCGGAFKKIHKYYHGGIVFIAPGAQDYRGPVVDYDKNSMYPYYFRDFDLPCGYPVPFKGKPKPTKYYPMFLSHISASFSIRPGKVPFLYENGKGYFATSLLSECRHPYDLYLTDIELARFLTDYDIYTIEYTDGYYFKKSPTEYRQKYVDHFYAEKKKWPDGNYNRQYAKDMLNSLTGKFGGSPERSKSTPYLNKEKALHYRFQAQEEKYRDALYIPTSVWITAYGRLGITELANENYARLLYIDTDAVHLKGTDIPLGTKISKDLGDVKLEKEALDCRYFGTKSYALLGTDNKIMIRMSGINAPRIYEGEQLRDIKSLTDFDGKATLAMITKKARIVEGGTIIEEVVIEKRIR